MKALTLRSLVFAFLVSITLGTNSCSSVEKGFFKSSQPKEYGDRLTIKVINDYRESKGLPKLEDAALFSALSFDYDKYMNSINIVGYAKSEKSEVKQQVEKELHKVVESNTLNYDNCSVMIDSFLNR